MKHYWAKVPDRLDWIVPFVIALVSLAVSGYVGYNQNDKDVSGRLTTLETQRIDDAGKIDHIQAQVDKLVEWALGHK